MASPSPDLSMLNAVWYGVYLDGSPATGSIELVYNGGTMLDDHAQHPISVVPIKLTAPIESYSLTTTDKLGASVTKTVGRALFEIPASNDPDLQGAGATWTLTETLNKGGGRTYPFIADINAPDGIIYLNKAAVSNVVPGLTYPVVQFSDLEALEARIDALELGASPEVQDEIAALESAIGTINATLSGRLAGIGFRYYTGSTWTARAAGVRNIAISTGYPAAPTPTGHVAGDIWIKDYAAGA